MRYVLFLVLIFASISGASVYHVKSATHNNDPTTVGTADNSSDPYGMQGALNNVGAGDEIRIWADGTYNVAATLNVNGTTGAINSWITINGATSGGVVDGTHAVFVATAELTSGVFHFDSDTTQYYKLNYLTIDGDDDGGTHASYCVYNEDAYDGQSNIQWFNCRFTDAGAAGVYWAGTRWVFYNCEADLNGTIGFETDDADGSISTLIGCSSHDNTSHGYYFDGAPSGMFGCISYDNGGDGIVIEATADYSCCINCTSYGNDSDGVFVDTGADNVVLLNTTSCSNGAYGFNLDSDILHFNFFGFNHANGNSTAETDIGGTWATFGNGSNQDGVPAFTSVVNGAEDFTPGSGSDLIGNGFPGTITDQSSGTQDGFMDIGALQKQESGGGGGGQPVFGGGVVR